MILFDSDVLAVGDSKMLNLPDPLTCEPSRLDQPFIYFGLQMGKNRMRQQC